MCKENLLLSADGDISLYKADKNIVDDLDELLKEFYKWKKTQCFDETLFVKFLKNKYGKNSIEFVKIVGTCWGKAQDSIEEEYKQTRWYNF